MIIHAVNPYGFAHLRRVNEENIDLNRNFIGEDDQYKGADPIYALLDELLNPSSPPPRLEMFTLRAGREIARHGFRFKSAVAQGNMSSSRALFWGSRPSSSKIIESNLPLGSAKRSE